MSEPVELARALTGQELPVTSLDLAGLVDELAALGWDAMSLAKLRSGRQKRRLPWPFQPDLEAVKEIGFSRFAARLSELRALLGLEGILFVPHPVDRPLSQEERRLIADRPPHW